MPTKPECMYSKTTFVVWFYSNVLPLFSSFAAVYYVTWTTLGGLSVDLRYAVYTFKFLSKQLKRLLLNRWCLLHSITPAQITFKEVCLCGNTHSRTLHHYLEKVSHIEHKGGHSWSSTRASWIALQWCNPHLLPTSRSCQVHSMWMS